MRTPDRDPSAKSRGQAFTLEAVVASVVVLGSLLFALQVSGVTSLAASTSSTQVLQQEEATAAGFLDAAAASESVKPTVRTCEPTTDFRDLLEETLRDRSLAFNVNLIYIDDGGVDREPLIRNGVPSDDAARATRTVTVYREEGNESCIPHGYPDDPVVWNVVRVEVVVWPV